MAERAIYLEEGKIKINEDVYATIITNKALETKGVAGMSGTFSDEVANLLGRKKTNEGVSISFEEDGALCIDMYVIVNYGYRIPDVALRLQERIKTALVDMTEAKVEHINIFVQGLVFNDLSQTIIKEQQDETTK
ncbi:alkaline shock protein [Veillonella montpellierensis DNF00314]|uniref:Alkaline shock protein n=1 Tax=Veillonella montpellierensis DNF00314 TaxID=1401067 RepID=A0A096AMC7_9FIRM|nr:Asp23/Gls24 family envelope stress response protein [Veillonella montpellierensis]KGF47965.1 alkaline shock protein [Veillonella montpellierensis DNF00314]